MNREGRKRRPLLLTPGPVAVPAATRLAGAQETLHHRTPEFERLLQDVDRKLKQVLLTRNPILYFAASGTGAMEACVANLLSPGDEAVVIEGGKFGQRWRRICEAFAVRTRVLAVEWGCAPDPAAVEALLRAHPKARVLLTQLFETSTATAYDVRALAQVAQAQGVVLVVDAISGLVAEPLETDAWGVDVVVGGSQKALMTPPGLSFVAVGERAWERVEQAELPRFYFDFARAREAPFRTPYTPAVSLLEQLDVSLTLLLEEGLERVQRRCALYAAATRQAAKALGLEVFSRRPGATCTALALTPPLSAKAVIRELEEGFQVQVAGGQDHLKGKIIRIAHVGDLRPTDVLGTLAALEIALYHLGHRFELGAGLRAAERAFAENDGAHTQI